MGDAKPLEEQSWEEFREAGLLWWVNRQLHLLGWALVVDVDQDTGAVKRAYPARTRFRGFDPASEDEGFKKVTAHLRANADRLAADCDWGGDAESPEA